MYTVIFLDQLQPKYSVWNVVDCMSIRVDIFIETYRGSHWFDDHVLSLSFSLSDIDDFPKMQIHLILNSIEYLQMYHPNMHACRLLLVISTDHTVATANYPTGDVQHVYVLPISHPIAWIRLRHSKANRNLCHISLIGAMRDRTHGSILIAMCWNSNEKIPFSIVVGIFILLR